VFGLNKKSPGKLSGDWLNSVVGLQGKNQEVLKTI